MYYLPRPICYRILMENDYTGSLCQGVAMRNNRRHTSSTNQIAFTLIELLVVVAIIAVLVAILLPSLAKARAGAQRAACLSNQKEIATALVGYSLQNRDRFPYAPSWANPTYLFEVYTPNGAEWPGNWFGLGYLFSSRTITDPKFLFCPSMKAEQFKYPAAWEYPERVIPSWKGWKMCGYLYRKYGEQDAEDPNTLWGALERPTPLAADIFIATGNPPPWPHVNPYGINVGFSDGHGDWVHVGHTEYRRRSNEYNWSGDINYAYDLSTYMFWQALDSGDWSKIQARFPLP